MNWTRKQIETGTEFTARSETGDRTWAVRKVSYPKPGFKNTVSRGWAIFLGNEQQGPTHPSAMKAMTQADQMEADLDQAQPQDQDQERHELENAAKPEGETTLMTDGGSADDDEELLEIRRDVIVAAVMKWGTEDRYSHFTYNPHLRAIREAALAFAAEEARQAR